ncbi:hypothetical protein PFISCL1PPCAC_11058, partial [Pristionchus fissidentatus]
MELCQVQSEPLVRGVICSQVLHDHYSLLNHGDYIRRSALQIAFAHMSSLCCEYEVLRLIATVDGCPARRQIRAGRIATVRVAEFGEIGESGGEIVLNGMFGFR